jgi:hypothetical protein
VLKFRNYLEGKHFLSWANPLSLYEIFVVQEKCQKITKAPFTQTFCEKLASPHYAS